MPGSGSFSGTFKYYYPGVTTANASIQQAAISYSNSSSFLGNSYVTLLGPLDVSKWTNYTITLINNGANTLESGSIEISPNGTNWEIIDNAFFAGLAAGAMTSSIYTEKSYKYLRVRGITSGSAGAFTGSIDTYLTVNNG